MDEVISRSGQFKKEDDQPLPKNSCQRQQICDNVVKVKFGISNRNLTIDQLVQQLQYLEVSNCSEGLAAPINGQEGHNSSN